MDGTEYITLKEAAEISGYSPDYVGQLIRRGKLPGKQVYANVAWVTPKQALLAYLKEKDPRPSDPAPAPNGGEPSWFAALAFHPERWEGIFRRIAFVIIGVSVVFLVLLFHILSTLIDDRLNQEALKRVSATTAASAETSI